MLLLHDQRLDDNVVRAFLFDCYDLYVKVRHNCRNGTCGITLIRSTVVVLTDYCVLCSCMDVCVQLLLNPFYDKSSVITSRAFDDRVRAIGDKYLNR